MLFRLTEQNCFTTVYQLFCSFLKEQGQAQRDDLVDLVLHGLRSKYVTSYCRRNIRAPLSSLLA